MDDREAIVRCKGGDTEAFRHLVERYQTAAIGHARALLADSEEARDVAQDAFVAAFRALNRFDEDRRFYPWLYTILRNRCLKVLAERRSRGRAPLDELEVVAAPPAISREELLTLERALRELAPAEREIVTLRHLDGLSYAELAELLDIPVGTVMSRLFTARRRLRERLEGQQGHDRKGRR